MIECTAKWHSTFEGGHVGVLLLSEINNSAPSSALNAKKLELESRLREEYAHFSRQDFFEIEVLKAYRNYYKLFGNTYHVQGQLESVVHKGKSLPSVSPLVDANFVAELDSLVLTAGHDADLLEPPLFIDATQDGEAFTQMNGKEKQLKVNDMMMRDAKGIVCTILYGQDKRTPISPKTKRALYVSYAPAGVKKEDVQKQLELIRQNVLLFAPAAVTEMLEIHAAQG